MRGRLAIGVVFAAVMWSAAHGQPVTRPPEGTGVYIMVLKDPDFAPPGEAKGRGREPDVTKYGGKVLRAARNTREIELPVAAAERLRSESSVAVLQRLWMGEPIDEFNRATMRSSERLIDTEEEVEVTWSTGTYLYDGSGNIKKIGDDVYTYDSAGRLLTALVNGVTETYKYDSFGNLTEKSLLGAPVATKINVDPSSNRLIGESYDAAGAVTTRKGMASYAYDSVGAHIGSTIRPPMGAATERLYIYTADDERIGVRRESIWMRWTIRDFEGRPLREFETSTDSMRSGWRWIEDYVYAEGKMVVAERDQYYGGKRHFHLDHLGSTRMITTGGKVATTVTRYYPFGAEQTSVAQEATEMGYDTIAEPIKFTGHERDYHGYRNVDNSDYVDYMHARYYDPNLGRFLSVDPVLAVRRAMHNPQGWNRYSYVQNNPINRVDPDGRLDGNAMGPLDWESGGLDRAEQLAVSNRTAAGTAILASLFLPGPEDVPLALVGATKAFRVAGRAVGRLFGLADEVPSAGSIRNVNPSGGTENCVNCAIATDATLAGRPASALPGRLTPISALEKTFGAKFTSMASQGAIQNTMAQAGNGARGIVYIGPRGGGAGHVFNVVNQGGVVRFLDGQTGKPAKFEKDWTDIRLLRTN